jgi:hypothetical protein
MQPAHDIAILPAAYHRRKRRWTSDGVALLSAAARVQRPSGLPPEIWRERRDCLLALLEWVDHRLPVAFSSTSRGHQRDVVAFGLFAYRFDQDERAVSAGQIVEGAFELCAYQVQLLRPLTTDWWLRRLAQHLGLAASGAQRDLFLADVVRAESDEWLASTAYRLLRRDPRFPVLRQSLQHAFRLDQDLIALALAASGTRDYTLTNDAYTHAWQHTETLGHVRRMTPGLLPVVWATLRHGECSRVHFPLAATKRLLQDNHGMSAAGWRLLARRGWRSMRALDGIVRGPRREVIARFFSWLAAIGVHSTPPPSVLRAYFQQYANGLDIRDWQPPESAAVMRIAFAEAERLRRSPSLDGFITDFLLVCDWAAVMRPALNRSERQAGWGLLVQRAREVEQRRRMLDELSRSVWPCPLTRIEYGHIVATMLADSLALADEGRAMRHCVAVYEDDCRSGCLRVLSLQVAESSKRLATLSVMLATDGMRWQLHEIKGFANTNARGGAREVAVEVLRQLNQPLLDLTLMAQTESFDDATYWPVRPHLDVVLTTLAGAPRSDFFALMNANFARGITPYLWRYVDERRIEEQIPDLYELVERLTQTSSRAELP